MLHIPQTLLDLLIEAMKSRFTGSIELHFYQGKPIVANRKDKIDLT